MLACILHEGQSSFCCGGRGVASTWLIQPEDGAISAPSWTRRLADVSGPALAGLLLLVNPMRGVLTLTLVLSVLFLLEGVFKVSLALTLRAVRGWGWLVASGLLPLLLGVLVLTGLPGTAAWALGLMVGINLLFTGFVLVSLARRLRPNDVG